MNLQQQIHYLDERLSGVQNKLMGSKLVISKGLKSYEYKLLMLRINRLDDRLYNLENSGQYPIEDCSDPDISEDNIRKDELYEKYTEDDDLKSESNSYSTFVNPDYTLVDINDIDTLAEIAYDGYRIKRENLDRSFMDTRIASAKLPLWKDLGILDKNCFKSVARSLHTAFFTSYYKDPKHKGKNNKSNETNKSKETTLPSDVYVDDYKKESLFIRGIIMLSLNLIKMVYTIQKK